MSLNKKIWYGDDLKKTINEDIAGSLPGPGPGPEPAEPAFTFDSMEITFDSITKTFDE